MSDICEGCGNPEDECRCPLPILCDCVKPREYNTDYPDGVIEVGADPDCPKCGGMADQHPTETYEEWYNRENGKWKR